MVVLRQKQSAQRKAGMPKNLDIHKLMAELERL